MKALSLLLSAGIVTRGRDSGSPFRLIPFRSAQGRIPNPLCPHHAVHIWVTPTGGVTPASAASVMSGGGGGGLGRWGVWAERDLRPVGPSAGADPCTVFKDQQVSAVMTVT